jgi:hypothetical protein
MSDIPTHLLREIERFKAIADKISTVLPQLEKMAPALDGAAGTAGLGDVVGEVHRRIDDVLAKIQALDEFRAKVEGILNQVLPVIEELKPLIDRIKAVAGAAPAEPSPPPSA